MHKEKSPATDPCACDAGKANHACCPSPGGTMLPIYKEPEKDEPCCGPPAGPASSPLEKPGYALCSFVEDFLDTPAGAVPRVHTVLNREDRWGTIKTRMGIGRDQYKVTPGLYAVGHPTQDSPVLVTANYKLSFDHLRCRLPHTDAWILVLDTRGINVWCAAGKGTFSTRELIERVQRTGLDSVVHHRRLILPQLGATGVRAREVRKGCGFEVVWGPIRAADIERFLAGERSDDMRRVTFSLNERMVLVPVEFYLIRKTFLWVVLAVFLLSGIGTGIFSFGAAWHRGLAALGVCLVGLVAGILLVPALLPKLPGRAFAFKGAVTGVLASVLWILFISGHPDLGLLSGTALVLFGTTISSYLGMNFTGSTPFTSPSGVEKEMRRAIPLQLAALALALSFWIAGGFS